MNIPGIPDPILSPQTWSSNAQLEQLSRLLATASRMPGSQLLPIQTVDVNPPGRPFQSATSMNRHIPDGKMAIRYPEPDVKNLEYDPALGYRFDPSTGLHYDANSTLFINKKLEILLKYDKLTNTYERAGSTADINAPVLVKEFAELMGYDTAPTPAPPPETPFPAMPAVSPDRFTGVLSDERTSPPRDFKRSPVRGRSSARDRSLSQKSGRVRRRSSSSDRSTNQRGDARSKRGRRRKSSSSSSPRRMKRKGSRSKSRSKGRGSKEGGTRWEETLNSIVRIHERNLTNPDNLFSRFLPPTITLTMQSQLEFIMLTPIPPKGDRELGDLEILFKGILQANDVPYRNVKLFQKNGNTPCDVCFIRFKKQPDATRWYLLHKGALDLANPDGSKCTSYMYFSEYYWKCNMCNYFNFPLRAFCYGCYRPRQVTKEMAIAPIVEAKVEDFYSSKWVGLKKLDFRFSSTQDVLDSLPPLNTFEIETCEFMTEENGLPLGLCIFEMGGHNLAKELYKFLQKRGLTPVLLYFISRVGLSNNPYSLSKNGWHQFTQTPDNTKSLGDYILRNWPVDTQVPNQKGTQTVLVYKILGK